MANHVLAQLIFHVSWGMDVAHKAIACEGNKIEDATSWFCRAYCVSYRI
jgi:hypothetical protein